MATTRRRSFAEHEFRRYLTCGILAFGFARARCIDCREERLVAFSCKGRCVCPSCTNRRMAEVAAHLSDSVVPAVPMRQWVLSVPKRLRPHLMRDAGLGGAVLRVLLRVIRGELRTSVRRTLGLAVGLDAGRARALTSILQRRILRLYVRRGLLTEADADDMLTWRGTGGFSLDGSVRIAAHDRGYEPLNLTRLSCKVVQCSSGDSLRFEIGERGLVSHG